MQNPRSAGALSFAAALLAALGAGCASAPAGDGSGQATPVSKMDGMAGGMMAGRMAMASLTPTQGSTVHGLVMFHWMDGHLMAHAKLSGLRPNAEHGFHVHETGSCASTDGSSAGGHFNPDGQPHGPPAAAHHTGDLPALKSDANGVVDQKIMVAGGPTLAAGPFSLVGRSVIVHDQADDYTTQPTGNSGARIACGVIAAH